MARLPRRPPDQTSRSAYDPATEADDATNEPGASLDDEAEGDNWRQIGDVLRPFVGRLRRVP